MCVLCVRVYFVFIPVLCLCSLMARVAVVIELGKDRKEEDKKNELRKKAWITKCREEEKKECKDKGGFKRSIPR